MKAIVSWYVIGCLSLTYAASSSLGANPATTDSSAGSRLIWQIGTSDDLCDEFALAPGNYTDYDRPGLFVIGRSDPKKSWSYIHPGPSDGWAGQKPHTFHVIFALAAAPEAGTCQLIVDLRDAHETTPPKLEITINERSFEHVTSRGKGTASLRDQMLGGREQLIQIEFPADLLRAGNNELSITTRSGSWMTYDWLGLEAPASTEWAETAGTSLRSVASESALTSRHGKLYQNVMAEVIHAGEPTTATLHVSGQGQTRFVMPPVTVALEPGTNASAIPLPAVEKATDVTVELEIAGETVSSRQHRLEPVRKWVMYLLPHSHVDIGFTELQPEVEHKQWRNFELAIDLTAKTSAYPEGARFKWNSEVLWAVDSYLKQASDEQRQAFIDAVRQGRLGLDALYGNELTALCRPEELVRLVDCADRLEARYGLTIDAAMISDVSGYTWGMVPVLAQSGVKYFSLGPNYIPNRPRGGARIGYTLEAWGDRPFYWVSPSGNDRVLTWMAGKGYSWFHFRDINTDRLTTHLRMLEERGYPYDIVQARYTIGGDNGPPDPKLSEFVRDWNERYAYPKLIIATTSEAFRAFEQRYSDTIPSVSGDFTPYWEDGAASSARETAANRAAAERLVQAETLWALLDPAHYPDEDFYAAWRNVILYDEHTWGASWGRFPIDSEGYNAQWAIKKAFALDAKAQSRKLLNDAAAHQRSDAEQITTIDVFNTCSWPRTDLVVLPADWKLAGDTVSDDRGMPVPSQRLSGGELAFLARDVEPMGATRFILTESPATGPPAKTAYVEDATLGNDAIELAVDGQTGAITSLIWKETGVDLAGGDKSVGLNDYFYVTGTIPGEPRRNGPVSVTVTEKGPLVAALRVESDAPGCRRLIRELRVVAGMERVDLVNVIDKEKVLEKESVHLGFAFNVPEGVMRLDMPWSVVRPQADQLPGANRNVFTIQRWADVSNQDVGVTLATVDAPLVEVGGMTADAWKSDPSRPWIKTLEPTQTLYSYPMNNYWYTNYQAYQEGKVTFRYAIKPHHRFDPGAATRFGTEVSQPLVAVAVDPDQPMFRSRLQVTPEGVVVTALRPVKQGRVLLVRLFNATGRPENVQLSWTEPAPIRAERCDLSGVPIAEATGPIKMSAWQVATLRATFSE